MKCSKGDSDPPLPEKNNCRSLDFAATYEMAAPFRMTGLGGAAVSQVPKCEGPGAPSRGGRIRLRWEVLP
jgi:hypothetical protein